MTGADDRTIPQALDAERAAIGAALLSSEAARAIVRSGLAASDFYKPAHQFIYEAIRSFVDVDVTFDAVILAGDLRTDGHLEMTGGLEYLLELQSATYATSHAHRYAAAIRDAAASRRLIQVGAEISALGFDKPDDVLSALATAETKLIELVDFAAGQQPTERLRAALLNGDAIGSITPPEPLIDGVLNRKSFTVVFGPPGGGKSFLVLDWALSIATGCWWLGHRVQRGRVLYVVAEGGEGMGMRLNAWRISRNVHDVTGIDWLPLPVNLYNAKEINELVALTAGAGYELIIIDTLARSMVGAEENSARDMGLVIDAIDRLRSSSGAAVIAVHHTPRDGMSPRGSTALEGAADTTVRVTNSDSRIQIENPKQKHANTFDTIHLRLDSVEDSAVLQRGPSTVADDDRTSTRAVQLLEQLDSIDAGTGMSSKAWEEAVEQLGINRNQYFQTRKFLVTRGMVEQDGTGQRAPWKLTELGLSTITRPSAAA